jgi:hypothetical protein
VNKSVAPPLTSKLLPEKIVGDENMSWIENVWIGDFLWFIR